MKKKVYSPGLCVVIWSSHPPNPTFFFLMDFLPIPNPPSLSFAPKRRFRTGRKIPREKKKDYFSTNAPPFRNALQCNAKSPRPQFAPWCDLANAGANDLLIRPKSPMAMPTMQSLSYTMRIRTMRSVRWSPHDGIRSMRMEQNDGIQQDGAKTECAG